MNREDYINLNEKLETILEEHKNSFFCQNLDFYYKKISEIYNDYKNIEYDDLPSKSITYEEVFSLIGEYLYNLHPYLKEDFDRKLSSGQININYKEDYDSNYNTSVVPYYEFGYDFCNIEFCRNELYDIQIDDNDIIKFYKPTRFIELTNIETNYTLLIILLHEYIHSIFPIENEYLNAYELNDILAELVSFYFQFDFINFLISKNIDFAYLSFIPITQINSTMNYIKYDYYLETIALLYKKQKEGVIDEHSYKTGEVEFDKSSFELMSLAVNESIDFEDTLETFGYCMGIPSSLYLLNYKNIKDCLVDVIVNANYKSVISLIHNINTSIEELRCVNFGKIMKNELEKYESLLENSKHL